ncbi:hypothetical protein FFZ77_02610 [Streptomyces katsurahamanus]|uniref:LPXTG cell wall anchor domain-containing protein n=1 Tax=Streptomyces katsurahamanus TaxID=2577098 RepID=A0ABW9NNR6_9ACTN|nr:hypothetical protein [Streptomyces katsurahamanus]
MSVSVACRPLLTAAAAGILLCALWFVPSANASVDQGVVEQQQTGVTTPEQLRLADTGSFDTTPYLVGGAGFLGVGVAFVTYAVRRRGPVTM